METPMPDRSYVPAGGQVLTPYICCREATKAIEWYGEVLGARLIGEPFVDPDGRVGHAEIEIDGAPVMLSDAYPEVHVAAAEPGADATYTLHLYVPDADATVAAVARAGATVQREVEDQFYGARMGVIVDPFGVRWMVSTQVRSPGEDEMSAARQTFTESG
jgi:PhnB protein